MNNILLIEHSLSDKSDLGQQLSEQGYSVHRVNNAFDALVYMETTQLEAILLDYSVPKMDSFWLLVTRKPSTAIIVLADSRCELERINALELGADDYLAKPINIRELQLRLNVLHRSHFPSASARCWKASFSSKSITCSSPIPLT